MGTKRFRIVNRWIQDGYMCGKVVVINDDNNEIEKIQARQVADQVGYLIIQIIVLEFFYSFIIFRYGRILLILLILQTLVLIGASSN